MKLKEIFKKPVDRPIEGVIKADDNKNILQEIQEYVVTNEIAKRLDNFLDSYIDYHNANGVWISGFFGSGKSHMLKVLSYLLEDKYVQDERLADIFIEKLKEHGDEFLVKKFEKAVSIPSRNILFNIDQKADVISKDQTDAILSVFMKVFNEIQGYYPKTGYIAEFERDIDEHGIYDMFKDNYKEVSGKEWEKDRKRVHKLKNEKFAQAFHKTNPEVSYEEALKILDKYRSDYNLSIEDFAERVKKYIDNQEKNFRLNFYVDEVGQYIADRVKLMTNLQTIAESLATKCRGQAWIIVTSQEEIQTVIGDMDHKQSNDFSKIRDRFSIRLKLTSSDVAEVVQKRLLYKNDEGRKLLEPVFDKEEHNFRTIFQFGDGSRTYKGYRDSEHFIQCYPFIPYQFDLFQMAIMGLSSHNAFEGKHRSVGERSMLGVFSQIVKENINPDISLLNSLEDQGNKKPTDTSYLATFDMMYEGLSSAMKTEIQSAINQADKHLANKLAIKALKCLLLVKFVKEFKATARNIAILLIDSFKLKTSEHEKNVREALNILEQETYIQRNGEIYEFLTDDEKDVEEEIKAQEIEPSASCDLLGEILRLDIFKDRKIRYDQNKNDYPFCWRIDGNLMGNERELSINVITPFNDEHENTSGLLAGTMGKAEMLIILPPDTKLIPDLTIHEKTKKYREVSISTSLKENIRKILNEKAEQNNKRKAELINRIKYLIIRSKVIINGSEIDITSTTDHKNFFIMHFQQLINYVYPNLRMLNTGYTENHLYKILVDDQDDLFSSSDTPMTEAETEMLTIIERKKSNGERSTLKTLLEQFSKRPYGWPQTGILCVAARLVKLCKIEVKQDSNLLSNEQAYENFSNNRYFENTILDIQKSIPAAEIRKLKNFYNEFFNKTVSAGEAREIADILKQDLKTEIEKIRGLINRQSEYPFLSCLKTTCSRIEEIAEKRYEYYYEHLSSFEDELLDAKEELIDPVKKFMNGNMSSIYREIVSFVNSGHANMTYVKIPELETIKSLSTAEKPFKGNLIRDAKQAYEKFREEEKNILEKTRKNTIKSLEDLKTKIQGMTDFSELNDDQRSVVDSKFRDLEEILKQNNFIATIKDLYNEFKDSTYPELLQKVTNLASQNKVTVAAETENDGDQGEVIPPVKPEISIIPKSNISVSYEKPYLKTEDDVNEYIDLMKKKYIEIINDGNGISV